MTLHLPLRTFLIACTCTLLLLRIAAADPATADPSLAKPANPTAQEHVATGNKLYRLGEFAKAIDEYKAGALVQDAPVFYFNLGQCYRQMGAYKEAIWQYERFLALGKPRGEVKAAVEAFLVQMKSELEKKAMKQPPLEAAPESLQPRAPTQPNTPTVAIEQPLPWHADRWGWGVVAGGVVAGGVSGFLFWSALNLDNDANDEPDSRRQDELHSRADTRRVIGVFVGIGGAALIATGIIKLAITDADRPASTAWHFAVHRQGVALFGRF